MALGVSHAQVVSVVLGSFEANQVKVADGYHRFLHRDPDLAGFNAFCLAMAAGAQDEQLEAAMAGSNEYASHL
jgi:hypothetical protein